MTKPLVYIAGPIYGSGTPNGNLRRALDAAELLMSAGAIPFVPHLFLEWEKVHFHEGDQEFWQEMDFAWLAKCDALVRLDGPSPGSDREMAFAEEREIPCFHAEDLTGAARGVDSGVHRFIAALSSGRFTRHLIAEELAEVEHSAVEEHKRDVQEMQRLVAEWISRQPFGKGEVPPHQPLLGISEEVGELCHAHLKHEQNIRGVDDKRAREMKMDALGDLFIYMCGYADANGLDLWECIEGAWAEVSKRDWNKNPENGAPVPTGPARRVPASFYSDMHPKGSYIVEEHGD